MSLGISHLKLRSLCLRRTVVTFNKSVQQLSSLSKCDTWKISKHSTYKRVSDIPAGSLNSSALFQGCLLLSQSRHYEIIPRRNENTLDMKPDALDILGTAIRAVHPRSMIQNTLQYDLTTSILKVQEKQYRLDKNLFVVGFGSAVLGMARAVEDMLGKHIVTGIVSIPHGLQEGLSEANRSDMLLSPNTKFEVFKGAADEEMFDKMSFSASVAINNLVTKLGKNDVLIVLCSGGGSILYPSPHPPITLEELHKLTRLLLRNGANSRELNIVRKNIETLKGGGLAMKAKPAKVLTLILSSSIGDPADMIASGPTCPTQRTPHHCLEILHRLNVIDKTPESIRKFLERECKNLMIRQAETAQNPSQAKAEQDAIWQDVQNVIVGNNSKALEVAVPRALELGYLPLIVTKSFSMQARQLGTLSAKLGKFIMMCFDRKASSEPNGDLAMLELELVAKGVRKETLNKISNGVDKAYHMNLDMCIIGGGEIVIHIDGSGVGGKNMEAALAAAVEMQEFIAQDMHFADTGMCFLSCDSVGHDGNTKMAGAVVDQEFFNHMTESGLDIQSYLEDNDSFTLFSKVNKGRNLISTGLTGTNIMDFVIILVQKPRAGRRQEL